MYGKLAEVARASLWVCSWLEQVYYRLGAVKVVHEPDVSRALSVTAYGELKV